MQIIGPRLPLPPGLSANRPTTERESAYEQAAESRHRDTGRASQHPAERIIKGEWIDNATASPRDRANSYANVDPARRPAISAYQQMQTISPRPQDTAGQYLDLFV